MSKTFAATRAPVAHQPLATAPARAARWHVATWLVLLALCMLGVGAQASAQPQNKQKRPNILFIIMDDVGIDQMSKFGYGGIDAPQTPTIDKLADAGIRFRNTWSMPACSTSRAVFYTGRFPLRTRVYGALGPQDLANSQVSPYEVTVPKLLKQAGYQSALFGKFHLGLQGNNPYREAMPHALGWDYFYGWLDVTGDPSSIDTTAGNVGPVNPLDGKGPYSCGFVPGTDKDATYGADVGACYAANGSCQEMRTAEGVPPGRQCRDRGGILVPNQACSRRMPGNVRQGFGNLNAHYVSPLVITDGGKVIPVPPQDIRARTYRGTAPVDAAIDWIQSQPKHRPWMASVSFASAHTPVMQPPQSLLTSGRAAADPALVSALSCVSGSDAREIAEQRLLTNLMVEAMDTEIARLLVSTGLARRDHEGQLRYNPHTRDTMIIVLGDNGSLGTTVKPPFDPSRAKGTAYQTGVWVPLLVAGPLVKKPDRDVPHMVNIADLYQLFGEIAGIDVQASVPRRLDAMSMLPYLTQPNSASIRSWNFTQVAPNLQAGLTLNSPCVINNACTQIPVTRSVCNDNGGQWFSQYKTCCSLNLYENTSYTLQPLTSVAVRNDRYKLVRNGFINTRQANSCGPDEQEEFYRINENQDPRRLLIDRKDLDLLKLDKRTPDEEANLRALRQQLREILESEPPCPADGNSDGVVNAQDLSNASLFAALPLQTNGYNSSWYDVNLDGLTDRKDLAFIRQRQDPPTQCR